MSTEYGLIGSLFTGYGGLDLGVNMALGGGLQVAYTSDIESGPIAIEAWHAKDCGDPPNLGDIMRIDGTRLPAVDAMCGGSPCFPAGALVLTDRGFTPIEEVRVGDLALTHLGRWRRVTAVGSHIGDTVVLRGQGSPGIECTPNHPFWSGRREAVYGKEHGRTTYHSVFHETGWTPAADMAGRMWLNAGGRIPALPIPEFDFTGCQTRDIRLSDAFFYFIGRWLGDGWLNVFKRPGRRASYMKRVFVCDSLDKEVELRAMVAEIGLRSSISHERTTVRVCVSSTVLYDWIESNFGKGAADKTIPAWAFGMPESWRRALLRGYWESDGNPTSNGMHATSVSKRLLLGIKMLEAGLGRPSSLSMHEPSRVKCVIERRVVNEKTNYMIATYDNPRQSVVCDTGYWGRVRKVEPGRKDVRVWDLTVEEDHSFTVDGVCVSNCQSISLAGLRAGMREGTRSGLWSFQADMIAACRPPLMVWENVAGALSSPASCREDLREWEKRVRSLNATGLCACETPAIQAPEGFVPPAPDTEGAPSVAVALKAFLHDDPVRLASVRCTTCGRRLYEMSGERILADKERLNSVHAQPTIRALGRVLGDLSNLGYDAIWHGVEAAAVGAPHRRFRLFITAWPHNPERMPVNKRLRRLVEAGPIHPKSNYWAYWDRERDVWMLPNTDLFGEQTVFMQAWPKHGILSRGRVYHMPKTWLTIDNLASAGTVFPTPGASMSEHGGSVKPDIRRAHHHMVNLPDEIEQGDQISMLPTPQALYDSVKTGTPANTFQRVHNGKQLGLADIINLLRTDANMTVLFPTPTANDWNGGAMNPMQRAKAGHAVTIPDWVEKSSDITISAGSLLKTPRAADRHAANGNGSLAEDLGLAFHMGEICFLPTPVSRDGKGANQRHDPSCMPVAIETMIVRQSDGEPAVSWGLDDGIGVDYGRFTTAIRRWEQIFHRPAPCPLQITGGLRKWIQVNQSNPMLFNSHWLIRHAVHDDGKAYVNRPERERMWRRFVTADRGRSLLDPCFYPACVDWDADLPIPATRLPAKPVLDYWRTRTVGRFPSAGCLSPRFVEWMMGLPDGWVTDPCIWKHTTGNHRNLQLRALGNGVVPQQAALAVDWSLTIRERLTESNQTSAGSGILWNGDSDASVS